MKAFKAILPVFLTIAFIIAGCSHGNSPLVPNSNEGIINASSDAHNLLALYTFVCDPASGTVEIIPLRYSELHLNALKFLEPPPYVHLTIEGPPKFNGKIIDVDIGLRNPYLGQDIYTGFDVCGIVFTHGSYSGFQDPDIVMAGDDDTRLLNADGHSRWWNPAEFPHGNTIFNYKDGLLGTPADQADFNATVNGYKYFADGLDKDAPLTTLDLNQRGLFRAGQKNIRHYTIDFSDGLIFNYAIDACWKLPEGPPPITVPDDFPPAANRPEAYHLSITEIENTLYYETSTGDAGGDLKLHIDVWDHFNAGLNMVSAESLAGLPFTSSTSPVGGGMGYSTYTLDLSGDALTQNGDAELLITVQSENEGYGGILPGKPVCAYFKHTLNISDQNPNPEQGGWVVTFGGGKNCWDYGFGVAIDDTGNAYITGGFRGTADFDPGPGVVERTAIGYRDAYLCKYDTNGNLIWVHTWGGPDDPNNPADSVYGTALTTGTSGDLYVGGLFGTTTDFDPGPGIDERATQGGYDFFLCKYTTDGNYEWCHTWGGEHWDSIWGIAVDPPNDVYMSGRFHDEIDFDPGPGIDLHDAGDVHDAFLSKIDTGGAFQWAINWGCIYSDSAVSASNVAIDSEGCVYTTGYFVGIADFDPGPGSEEHIPNGVWDIFISKFDSDGIFQWTRVFGGKEMDSGRYICTDDNDNIYATGVFRDTVDFDAGPDTDEHTSEAGQNYPNAYLTSYKSDGEYRWTKTWGGPESGEGTAIVSDGAGNIYVTGKFWDTADFDPGPGIDEHTAYGLWDIFLSKFDSDGNYIWGRSWGSEERDAGYCVANDSNNSVYVVGDFYYTVDFDPGPDVDERTSNGSGDVFLMKLMEDGYW